MGGTVPPRRLGAHTTRTSPQPTHQTVTALNKTQHKHQQLTTLLKTPGQQQQQPDMNKHNATTAATTAPASTSKLCTPDFAPEQLPEVWRQLTEPGSRPLDQARQKLWNYGIEAIYRRCETYPQYTAATSILSSMPADAWHDTARATDHGISLARQATPEHILQALAHEQRHPGGWWRVSEHILSWAGVEQMTGPVIEQLEWDRHLSNTAVTTKQARLPILWSHIVEHTKQHLLADDSNAWEIFLSIAKEGATISENAELAHAIEHKQRPARHGT